DPPAAVRVDHHVAAGDGLGVPAEELGIERPRCLRLGSVQLEVQHRVRHGVPPWSALLKGRPYADRIRSASRLGSTSNGYLWTQCPVPEPARRGDAMDSLVLIAIAAAGIYVGFAVGLLLTLRARRGWHGGGGRPPRFPEPTPPSDFDLWEDEF